MELAWTGFDCGSGDHPMNTSIRYKRPGRARAPFEEQIGKDVNEVFPEEDLFVMHRVPFRERDHARRERRAATSRTRSAGAA